jgi:hypothetical protein
LIAALVHGSGYERIATTGCSDRTLAAPPAARMGRGRAAAALLRICLIAYDRVIGSTQRAVRGWVHHQAPCGGEVKIAAPSPVDRRKQA